MSYTGVNGIRGVTTGRRYLELELVALDVSVADAVNCQFGIVSTTVEPAGAVASINGNGTGGIDGSLLWEPDLPGGEMVAGDVLRFWVDFGTGLMWMGINDILSGDPIAGTGAINESNPLPEGTWYARAMMPMFEGIEDPTARRTIVRLRARSDQFLLGPGDNTWSAWET